MAPNSSAWYSRLKNTNITLDLPSTWRAHGKYYTNITQILKIKTYQVLGELIAPPSRCSLMLHQWWLNTVQYFDFLNVDTSQIHKYKQELKFRKQGIQSTDRVERSNKVVESMIVKKGLTWIQQHLLCSAGIASVLSKSDMMMMIMMIDGYISDDESPRQQQRQYHQSWHRHGPIWAGQLSGCTLIKPSETSGAVKSYLSV